jgi:hypothetical protein
MQSRVFITILLVWFFGWGSLLLKFPRQCHRVLSLGKEPSPKHLKLARIVGYMGIFFGVLLVIELALGIQKIK